MELAAILYILLGVTGVFTFTLTTLVFCQKRHEYWFAVLANGLACIFCWLAVSSQASPELLNTIILSSVAASLFSVPAIWRDMVIRAVEYAYHWTLLFFIVALVLINQFFFKEPWILILPAGLVSLVVLIRLLKTHNLLLLANKKITEELQAKNITIGLDLATGLPNKMAFAERIEKWLFINPEIHLNVLVFKFTRFKELNALIGHNNADLVKLQLITRLRKRLLNCKSVLLLSDSANSALFATVGGVDFVLAVKEEKHNYATEYVIDLLKESITEPIAVDITAVDVGLEFGVASYPDQGNSIENLIECAYLAMNNAQISDSSVYFDLKQQTKLLVGKTMIGQLKNDLSQNKFSLFVQPQVALTSRQIVGGELLIRWKRDEKGVIEADEFISLAEQSGVIYRLNMWCIEQAIQTLVSLKQQNLPQTLSVNVSNRELFQSSLVERITTLVDEYMINPEKLVIEIKESAFAENKHKALKVSRLLQQAGVRVAIDDFGKDRTAIATFNHFTPYYLKVDCRHLSKGNRGDKINVYTNAIIGMAKTLQIPVIAQGIETELTLQQLHDLECDVGQGFYFSKPFELKGFAVWIEQWRRNEQGLT